MTTTDGSTLHYSDIITPDDSITKLISQLESLTTSVSTMMEVVKKSASSTAASLKSVSGATKEGRKEIDESTKAAERLKRAQQELAFSMTEAGREVAWLKEQVRENNKMSVESKKAVSEMIGYYNRLDAELKENIRLWKSLSEEELRDAEFGGALARTIRNIRDELSELNSRIKTQVTSYSELERAEQKLSFLRSEEGQELLRVRQQIREVIAESKGEKAIKDELTKAYEKLNYLRSEEGQELLRVRQQIREIIAASKEEKAAKDELTKAYEKYDYVHSETYRDIVQVNQAIKEQQRLVQLTNQLNRSAVGSYNQLAAQYELNRIKLNAMSAEERRAVDIGQKLEQETLRIYKQMQYLQEAMGNHRLSVGHYAKSWNGLGMAMNQIMREIPAMTMGINMFFLAISNNVPILIDEIQRVRQQNKLLAAEGKQTVSIAKTIASSIFGWQSALILLMTVMSMHGKTIMNWIKQLGNAEYKVKRVGEAIKEITKELEKSGSKYGDNIVLLKRLSAEWQRLTSNNERIQFIKDNTSANDQLGVSINNVNDAERVYVEQTAAVVAAIRLRAKATAAEKLASESYQKAFSKREEAKNIEKNPVDNLSFWDVAYGMIGTYSGRKGVENINKQLENRVKNLNKEADAAEADADAYFELADAYEAEADAALKAAGIDKNHKNKTSHSRTPRDPEDQIYKKYIETQSKYEKSITDLIRDEDKKRIKESEDALHKKLALLEEEYRKNEKMLNGQYKNMAKLTPEQREMVEQMQLWLTEMAYNYMQQSAYEIDQLYKDIQIRILDLGSKTTKLMLDGTKKGTDEELELRLGLLEISKQKELVENSKLEENMRQDELDIIKKYNRLKEQTILEYDKSYVDLVNKRIDKELGIVRAGSSAELKLKLEQLKNDEEIAVKENEILDYKFRVAESIIRAGYEKQRNLLRGEYILKSLEELQKAEEAEFNIRAHSQTAITRFTLQQEKERWEKQIEIAKQGALDWGDEQFRIAEAELLRINRELREASFIGQIGELGFGGAILDALGFSEKDIETFNEYADRIIDDINRIIEAEIEAAEKAVAIAERRVSAAQSAYEAEVEARNNGYAHNVATAKKELDNEKRNQKQKELMLAAAQRKQERINALTQASSLLTASANIWSAFSGLGPWGIPLAIAAIATMWTSFAVSKIKANQITQSVQEYGEGGLEFLDGGSHASGNDIDLGTTNRKGRRMRAEGGEAMAIINKKQTRRYKRALPGIIDSLNKGTFEDKYINAFNSNETINLMNTQKAVDLSRLERSVDDIRKQNKERYVIMPDGTVIIYSKNVKRIIKS